MRAVIVGGGIGGLSTALLLRGKFEEVVVVEKNSTVGGRARSFRAGEFKFDMGPSWYLMPEVFERFFREIGENPHPVVRVNPLVRVDSGKLGERGESVTFHEIAEEMRDYLEDTGYMYEVAMRKFLNKEMTILDFLDREVLSNLGRIPLWESLDRFNSRYFRTDLMRKAMGFSSVFLGGSPFNTPAVYAMVNYTIYGQGVYYPKGGFEGYVDNLYQMCRRAGIEFRLNSPVTRVKVEDRRVMSVITPDGEVEGDVFVFNMDYHYADTLLPDEFQVEREWWRKKLAPSAILGYLGVEGEINLPHHTVIVNGDWADHFRSLEERRLPTPENMSYYVSYRRATDDNLLGRDLVILIPVAPGVNTKEELVKIALRDLEIKTGSKIQVKYSRIYGPEDFVRDYNAYQGTAFGLSHTLDQTGPFRLPMKNRKLRNLYYVGQYTQPGIGVPMVTLSSILVRDRILREM
ncbi:phytoene desaturase family protein [Metallosphaera javensis (ex Sakai et al. 2022)]|uniref:phytoene desaturase family protein n=1 Tax=Metallosphaera javensis (ex Sakai et al. 2022) TaxID=2775498 RepID=UPI00258A945B|nr:MAG: phytoene dehydrogenase [Metallosphaera javensis (ex Sakai et al. 2022)]